MIDDPDPSFEECFVFYGPDHPELEFDDSLDDPIVVNSEGNVFTINCKKSRELFKATKVRT